MILLDLIWPLQVGNALLGGLFQVLFDRLVPRANLSLIIPEHEVLAELSNWCTMLAMIQSALGDAEEKQWTNMAVKMWLGHLRDFAYDLEDMLDELNTDFLRRSLEESQTIDGLKNLLNNFKAKSKSGGMTQRLKELCDRTSLLGLVERTSTAVWRRPPSTCLPTEPAICGRDEDKSKILEMMSSGANFRVISIVGMAGVGKTTLAKQVYKHNHSTGHMADFYQRAWICVSNDFDVFRISKAILESITHSTCDLKDLNEVQVQLQMAVAGRRFLLVLDDVWCKNYDLWETLKSPFVTGAPGSIIIVTTRCTDVALTMGGLRDCYNLNLLSDDHCWSVFQMHAFENRNINAHQNLELVREKVVQKCGGLPLAARTLGGLLRSKHRDDEWEDILNCRIWDLPEDTHILPVLKLSYYHLPSHLKRCFAYCAILPKNYEFEEKELVLLWMAEGLILPSTNNKQLEDMGSEYFRNLLSISIFQQSTGNASKFAMHNLFNDLAQWVSGETCFRLEDKLGSNQLKRLRRARHSSYISSNFDGKNKFEVFDQVIDHLRTFLPILTHNLDCYISDEVIFNLLPKFKKLRVLSLRKYHITKLPDSIGELSYLRYLNLADTEIASLPDSITDLFNLQVLILRNCSRLSMLPPEVGTWINLRHLDIGGIKSITEMPSGMQELKYLETLSNFIVGKDSGSPLKDLKNLMFLGGELHISQLENVTDSHELGGAILYDKKKLEVLILEWGIVFDNSRNKDKEKDVLDMLRPHANLKKLAINNYGGSAFPAWIEDPSFSNMVVLRLEGCENCTSLPSLGVLSKLKKLTISGMKKLTKIDSGFYGSCSEPFQSLEILHLENLQEWSLWNPVGANVHDEVFGRLRELSIINCPRLSGFLPVHLPSLRKLAIQQCAELMVSISSIPMLCELEIEDCRKMEYTGGADSLSLNSISLSHFSEFGDWFGQAFQEVEELKIKCPTLVSIPEAPFLSSLSALEIKDCHALKSLWEVMEQSACLDRLVIEGCDSLTLIAKGKLPPSLKRLQISNCRKLLRLLDDGVANHINSSLLEHLYVSKCPALKSLSSTDQLSEALQHLEIQLCSTLTTIGQLPETLKHLDIKKCHELHSLSLSGQLPASLEYLSIYDSPITTLSSPGHLPASLQHLNIEFCSKLTSLSSGQLPATLKYLKINSCGIMSSIADGLQNLSNLQQINISNCPSLESFPQGGLPRTSLTVFSISSCLKLNALPSSMHTMNSLQELHILNLTSLSSFPQQGFPINLTSLSIISLQIYDQVMQRLHKLTSLRNLNIGGCQNAVSFPQEGMEMMLPTSLTRLTLTNFRKLRCLSLEGFRNLTSLECLSISLCPKLTSFLEKELSSSLLELYISNCSKLTVHCRHGGQYWSNISNIPYVMIDGKYIHEPRPV
ncbi:hypothetical protein Ddye_027774 [Dipteronia dyeriana]|uniref:Disease resistance RPP13-like protein 1 n=1 Tax=Dipteronia dyeriana TaxID=168575 RepID=A0AAD9TQQ1_9ROSI|nr:hypothetical protein Ddye_027774 [Dipteronia dyeriana]